MSFQEFTRRLWQLCARPVAEQGLEDRGGGLTPRYSRIPPMDIPRSGECSCLTWGPQMTLNLGNRSRQGGASFPWRIKGGASPLCCRALGFATGFFLSWKAFPLALPGLRLGSPGPFCTQEDVGMMEIIIVEIPDSQI